MGYEFNGSEVLNFRRYYDHEGYFVEEIFTADGGHWFSRTKPEDMDPDELEKLISYELNGEEGLRKSSL